MASRTVASFRTEETTLTIPPGVLQQGSYYYLRIASQTGVDITKPSKGSPDAARAEAITGAFSP
jgi:hypothetical protein